MLFSYPDLHIYPFLWDVKAKWCHVFFVTGVLWGFPQSYWINHHLSHKGRSVFYSRRSKSEAAFSQVWWIEVRPTGMIFSFFCSGRTICAVCCSILVYFLHRDILQRSFLIMTIWKNINKKTTSWYNNDKLTGYPLLHWLISIISLLNYIIICYI